MASLIKMEDYKNETDFKDEQYALIRDKKQDLHMAVWFKRTLSWHYDYDGCESIINDVIEYYLI
jgi:hypothetical protein